MKLYRLFLIVIIVGASEMVSAQSIFISPRPYYGPRYGRPHIRRSRPQKQYLPPFQPTVNLSFGYGFPNLDKQQLADFSGLTRGTATQMGPITGAIDYQFSRYMGIGVMVTHGTVSLPYYDYYAGTQTLKGSLDNWAFMLDLVRYMPIPNSIVTPYLRTAFGINSWKQDYTYTNGAKITYVDPPSDFAYQVGLGANFKLSKNAGLFIEAGYGKYILHGGISLKF